MEAILPTKVAIFPKIENSSKERLTKALDDNPNCIVIAREKIDGSNFTIFNDSLKLHFYNKNREIEGDKLQQSVFEYTVDALQNRRDIFWPGYTYHCEAMRKTRASHLKYRRIPRYHVICYEIEKPDGLTATPEEMLEILKDTGIEVVQKIWDNRTDTIEQLFQLIDQYNINAMQSMLGGAAEGIVVSFLNREKRGKITTFHLKFVADHMKERRDLNPGVFVGAIDDAMLAAIGDMYNMTPRFIKAVNRLEDQGLPVTIASASEDLDRDLEEEAKTDILEMLWKQCWPTIKRASKAGLFEYLTETGYVDDPKATAL